MLSAPLLFVLALLMGSGALAFAPGESIDEEIADLKLAPSAIDRVKLLDQDSDFVFDFSTAKSAGGAGGTLTAAVASTFPVLTDQHLSMAVGFLEPCGYVTPHTHPRATEIAYAVNGTMQVGFLQENGARFVFNEVGPGQATIFPKGSIHFEMNNGCEPMTFVAALNDEDPGVALTAQLYLGLPPDVVAATLGGLTIEQVAKIEAMVPDSVALGTDECLQRCGLTRTAQPTNQRQPRGPSNALPSGFSGPSVPEAAPSANRVSSNLANPLLDKDGKPQVLFIALISIVGVLLLGYIVIFVAYCVVSRREKRMRTKGGKYIKTGERYAPEGLNLESSTVPPYEGFKSPNDPYVGDSADFRLKSAFEN